MMRVILTPEFHRLAARENVSDKQVYKAARRAEAGLIDARLGGSLIKQRIARPGQGRSRGLRAVAAYQIGKVVIFIHLFPKSAKANLSKLEQEAFLKFAKGAVLLTEEQLDALIAQQAWREIDCDEDQEEVPE
jgi:hypothetical protein